MTKLAEIVRQREAVRNVYPIEDWAKRVNAMSDEEVTKLYRQMKTERKL